MRALVSVLAAALVALIGSGAIARAGDGVLCGHNVPGDSPHRAHFHLSPTATYNAVLPLNEGPFWVIVSPSCSRGSTITLRPRHILKIVERVRADGNVGLVGVRLDPRRIGTAVLTVRHHGALVGRLRLRIIKVVRGSSDRRDLSA